MTPQKWKDQYTSDDEGEGERSWMVPALMVSGADDSEETLDIMVVQWSWLVDTVNQMDAFIWSFCKQVGTDVDEVEAKIQMLDSRIGWGETTGSDANDEFKEDCITVWDTLTFLNGGEVENSKLGIELANELNKMGVKQECAQFPDHTKM